MLHRLTIEGPYFSHSLLVSESAVSKKCDLSMQKQGSADVVNLRLC